MHRMNIVERLCELDLPARIGVIALLFTAFAVAMLMLFAALMKRHANDPQRRAKKGWHARGLEDAELMAVAYHEGKDGHHGK